MLNGLKKTAVSLVALSGMLMPSLAPLHAAPIGKLHACFVFEDSYGNIMNSDQAKETLTSDGRLIWMPMYAYPTPSTGAPKNLLPYPFHSVWGNDSFYYNDDLFDSAYGSDAVCTTYYSLDVNGNYYYEPLNTAYAGGRFGEAEYHDNFMPGTTSINAFRPYDASLFDNNPANDAARIVRADGHLRLTNANNEKWLVAKIKVK